MLFIFTLVSVLLIGATTSDGSQNNTFGVLTAAPLIVGAVLSAFAGHRGMQIATQANARTTNAQTQEGGSITRVLRSPSSRGPSWAWRDRIRPVRHLAHVPHLPAANVNAADSWQYFQARIGALHRLFPAAGGGVTQRPQTSGPTRKVEAGIPEDHPNNAAVIADNVGDNVGDVAGMGADLFESYVGSIIASCALATQFTSWLTSVRPV